MAPQPWKILDSRMAFDHRWCKVRQDTVQLPNDTIIDDYFVTLGPEVAIVVPITPDGMVVFVRQYRHGIQDILIELPAGHFNPEEEAAEVAAKRELQEETGYGSDRWTFLGKIYDNPPKETNANHLFLAEQVTQVSVPQLDITEEIELVHIPISEVMDWVFRGNLRVSGTISALVLALHKCDRF